MADKTYNIEVVVEVTGKEGLDQLESKINKLKDLAGQGIRIGGEPGPTSTNGVSPVLGPVQGPIGQPPSVSPVFGPVQGPIGQPPSVRRMYAEYNQIKSQMDRLQELRSMDKSAMSISEEKELSAFGDTKEQAYRERRLGRLGNQIENVEYRERVKAQTKAQRDESLNRDITSYTSQMNPSQAEQFQSRMTELRDGGASTRQAFRMTRNQDKDYLRQKDLIGTIPAKDQDSVLDAAFTGSARDGTAYTEALRRVTKAYHDNARAVEEQTAETKRQRTRGDNSDWADYRASRHLDDAQFTASLSGESPAHQQQMIQSRMKGMDPNSIDYANLSRMDKGLSRKIALASDNSDWADYRADRQMDDAQFTASISGESPTRQRQMIQSRMKGMDPNSIDYAKLSRMDRGLRAKTGWNREVFSMGMYMNLMFGGMEIGRALSARNKGLGMQGAATNVEELAAGLEAEMQGAVGGMYGMAVAGLLDVAGVGPASRTRELTSSLRGSKLTDERGMLMRLAIAQPGIFSAMDGTDVGKARAAELQLKATHDAGLLMDTNSSAFAKQQIDKRKNWEERGSRDRSVRWMGYGRALGPNGVIIGGGLGLATDKIFSPEIVSAQDAKNAEMTISVIDQKRIVDDQVYKENVKQAKITIATAEAGSAGALKLARAALGNASSGELSIIQLEAKREQELAKLGLVKDGKVGYKNTDGSDITPYQAMDKEALDKQLIVATRQARYGDAMQYAQLRGVELLNSGASTRSALMAQQKLEEQSQRDLLGIASDEKRSWTPEQSKGMEEDGIKRDAQTKQLEDQEREIRQNASAMSSQAAMKPIESQFNPIRGEKIISFGSTNKRSNEADFDDERSWTPEQRKRMKEFRITQDAQTNQLEDQEREIRQNARAMSIGARATQIGMSGFSAQAAMQQIESQFNPIRDWKGNITSFGSIDKRRDEGDFKETFAAMTETYDAARRHAGITAEAGRVEMLGGIAAAGLRLSDRPMEAQVTEAIAKGKAASVGMNALSPDYIRTMMATTMNIAQIQRADALERQGIAINQGTRERQLQSMLSRNPYGARVQGVLGEALAEEFQLLRGGHPEEAAQARRLGQMQLDVMKQTYMDGFQAREVHPNLVRERKQDVSAPHDVLGEIAEARKKLSVAQAMPGGSGDLMALTAQTIDAIGVAVSKGITTFFAN